MLKQRVVTAVVLTAVLLLALFYIPLEWFGVFLAAVVLLGAWELADLAGLSTPWQRRLYTAFIGRALISVAYYLSFTRCVAFCSVVLTPEQTQPFPNQLLL